VSTYIDIHHIGIETRRSEGAAKVTGTAPYAYDQQVSHPAFLFPVLSTIARGTITSIDVEVAAALPGVVNVLTYRNAPRLAATDNRELAVLQSPAVAFRGEFVAAVVADSSEVAREAASAVRVTYEQSDHVVSLADERASLYRPDKVNPSFLTDTHAGDVASALRNADIVVDQTYTTPMEFNNPLEPHTTVAVWSDGTLLLYDSSQGVHVVRKTLAPILGLEPEQVRVVAPHIGGGFGSKGVPHAHDALVAMAAMRNPGRAVKFALTRQQMFFLAGHRTPTIQRIQLGADRAGALSVICHDVTEHTSTVREFAEQTAVASRMMYDAAARRTSHRLAALDVPIPSWMRAPGETPGMFALEVAMDELADACGLDPIVVRERNDPALDPDSGLPWSDRRLVECLHEGAAKFGWSNVDRASSRRRRGGWLVGTGVAASTYPGSRMTGSIAQISFRNGMYDVGIGAVDIGTGTRTALAQIAADALACPLDQVRISIGDTDLPEATVEGGSTGVSSWGSAIVAAAEKFRKTHGETPPDGTSARAETPTNPAAETHALHSFGAQFAEVHVHARTGEVRVSRMLGMFSVGRIINPVLARSQFVGGMTMGLSMALFEDGVLDPRFGHVINHDLAEYHVASHADVQSIEAYWLDGPDERANPMGARGIGEIGIVGAAAAVANAVTNATGIRCRDLPITLDRLLPDLDQGGV